MNPKSDRLCRVAERFESEVRPMIVNETRRLRRWPVVFVVAALACVAGPSEDDAVAGERITPVSAGATVSGLRPGWLDGDRAAGTDRAAARAAAL